jgi:hypothetical protein
MRQWGTVGSVLAFATVIGAIAVALGIEHNMQSEFVDASGKLDLLYCAQIFASWFALALLPAGAVAWLIRRLRSG